MLLLCSGVSWFRLPGAELFFTTEGLSFTDCLDERGPLVVPGGLVELCGTFPSVFGGFEVEMRISGIQSSTSHSSIQQRPEVGAQRCSVLELPVPAYPPPPPPPPSIRCCSLSVEKGHESAWR